MMWCLTEHKDNFVLAASIIAVIEIRADDKVKRTEPVQSQQAKLPALYLYVNVFLHTSTECISILPDKTGQRFAAHEINRFESLCTVLHAVIV
jgi:hypothetical protein